MPETMPRPSANASAAVAAAVANYTAPPAAAAPPPAGVFDLGVALLTLACPWLLLALFRWLVVLACACCGHPAVGRVVSVHPNVRSACGKGFRHERMLGLPATDVAAATAAARRARWRWRRQRRQAAPRPARRNEELWIVYHPRVPSGGSAGRRGHHRCGRCLRCCCCCTSSLWVYSYWVTLQEHGPAEKRKGDHLRLRYCVTCCCLRAEPAPFSCRRCCCTLLWDRMTDLFLVGLVGTAGLLLHLGSAAAAAEAPAADLGVNWLLLLVPAVLSLLCVFLCCCGNICFLRHQNYPEWLVEGEVRRLRDVGPLLLESAGATVGDGGAGASAEKDLADASHVHLQVENTASGDMFAEKDLADASHVHLNLQVEDAEVTGREAVSYSNSQASLTEPSFPAPAPASNSN